MAAGTAVSLPARSVCPKEFSGPWDRYETALWRAVYPSDGSPMHAAAWTVYSSTLESPLSGAGQQGPADPEGTGPTEADGPPASGSGSPWPASGPHARALTRRENCRSAEAGVLLRAPPRGSDSTVPAQLVRSFVV